MFVGQSDSSSGDVWFVDSGASCNTMHNNPNMYDIRSPPPGREAITTGNKRRLRVEYVGTVDDVFREYMDERCALVDVSYVLGLGFNLYSLNSVQRTNIVISDASGCAHP